MDLSQQWTIDLEDEIGRGGFARVVSAIGQDGTVAVAKLIPQVAGATRDMLAVSLPKSEHLVPILDVGQYENDWVLIMPRASHSLRDHLNDSGALPLLDALAILEQIAAGLTALQGNVVHRDLKPENILFLDGKWALADFGIARYVEATTALDTQKFSFTPPYAAPEQWKMERATPATDMYALGVISYEMCIGVRPFSGPKIEDFREQHLNARVEVPGLPKRLAGLITECLLKSDAARPSAANFEERIRRAGRESQSPGAFALAEAQRVVSEEKATRDRETAVRQSENERRGQLHESAKVLHELLVLEFAERVREEAPSAEVTIRDGELLIKLGLGTLRMGAVRSSFAQPWGPVGVDLDVISHAEIEVRQTRELNGCLGRSHSLYYCDFENPGEYAWHELAFMHTFGNESNFVPYAQTPGNESGMAISTVMTTSQLAWGFEHLSPSELDQFIDRWLGWFANAVQNKLRSPSSLPEGKTTYPRRGA
ncbi:MAG: serine/threonine protein kinase [Actinobacteria bacterium]|nr:serine/threonine protein kinase [Actinomycetota bacterium]